MQRLLFCQKVGGGNCPPAPSSLTPLQAEKKVTVVTSSAYFFSEFAQLVTVFFFLSRHKSRDPTVN